MFCKCLNGKRLLTYTLVVCALIIAIWSVKDLFFNDVSTPPISPFVEKVSWDDVLKGADKGSRIFYIQALRERDLDKAKRFLIEYTENFNQTIREYTATHLAVRSGVLELVQFAIAESPDEINVTDENGLTPLHHATGGWFDMDYYPNGLLTEEDMEIRREIVLLLIQKGADTDAKDNSGESPSDKARIVNFVELISLLEAASGEKPVGNK